MTSLSWCLTIGNMPCRLRYPVLVLSKLSAGKATTYWLSEWQPPEKAINTTICAVISLRAFTFNFSTVSCSASEAFVRKCRLEHTRARVAVRSQCDTIRKFGFLKCNTQNRTHHHHIAHQQHINLDFICPNHSVWVNESTHARAQTYEGRQPADGHRRKFPLFLWWKCHKKCVLSGSRTLYRRI